MQAVVAFGDHDCRSGSIFKGDGSVMMNVLRGRSLLDEATFIRGEVELLSFVLGMTDAAWAYLIGTCGESSFRNRVNVGVM